jgi:hypothetical protein
MKKMKMLIVVIIAMIALNGVAQSNDSCVTSMQICVETPISLPAGVAAGSAGNDIACMSSAPNPAWFCFQVQQFGRINLSISSLPQNDLDFVCWGPFSATSLNEFHNTGYCSQLLMDETPSHGPLNGVNPDNLGGFPVGNIVDCSFTTQSVEYVHVPNASVGDWYLILVTNYSNQPSVISIVSDTSSVGASNCNIQSPFLSLNVDTISDLIDDNVCGVPVPKSYTLSGYYLTNVPDSILVSAPAHYEVSLSEFSEFKDSLYVPCDFAILPPTTIFVKIKSDLELGNYNSEPIIHSGGGADPVVLICNGSVIDLNGINGNDSGGRGITVFPNPASDILNCTFETSINRKFSIVDVLGKTVKSWNSKLQKELIDVKSLPNGVYFLKVEEDGNQYSTKFVIR